MIDNQWNIDRVYWYARGYHDGRAYGYNNTDYDMLDEYQYYYGKGYETGVTDYCLYDESGDE